MFTNVYPAIRNAYCPCEYHDCVVFVLEKQGSKHCKAECICGVVRDEPVLSAAIFQRMYQRFQFFDMTRAQAFENIFEEMHRKLVGKGKRNSQHNQHGYAPHTFPDDNNDGDNQIQRNPEPCGAEYYHHRVKPIEMKSVKKDKQIRIPIRKSALHHSLTINHQSTSLSRYELFSPNE
jgi:hypothetical protein